MNELQYVDKYTELVLKNYRKTKKYNRYKPFEWDFKYYF